MKKLDSYTIDADGIQAEVQIKGEKDRALQYQLVLHGLAPGTLALFEEARERMVTELNLSTAEISDPSGLIQLRKEFHERAAQILHDIVPKLGESETKFLSATLMQDMLGLGEVEFLISDEQLEEIIITSSKDPIRVHHRKHGWLVSNMLIPNEGQIENYASIIARKVGQQVSNLAPLLDAHLITGDRVNAVLYPISNHGNTITIRKFARDPWTFVDFMKNKTCDAKTFALIWLALEYELNLLISGGTGSGKTSFLNVCMPFMPPNHRIISIEDTRELQLPSFLYWSPLVTRAPNPEGKGGVSMNDLLINSLRMRPDRIILGEIRRKHDAQVLFEAMRTGHSVYATVHADSVQETIRRLINPPIDLPGSMLDAVDLNVVMFRDRKKGFRRVFQLGEFLTKDKMDGSSVRPNIVARWDPTSDDLVSHNKPVRLYEELGRHTGMSETDIRKDLKDREALLRAMVAENIRSLEQVGKVMHQYYLHRETVIDIVKKKKKLGDLL